MSSEPTQFPGVSTKPYRLLEQVDASMRLRHYSGSTIKAYSQWIRRFIYFHFHNKRHPKEMGEPEVTEFLSHLASSPGG